MSTHSIWSHYRADKAYDEMIDAGGKPRETCANLSQYLQSLGTEAIKGRLSAAEAAILEMGITFTVYSEKVILIGLGRLTLSPD